MNRTLVGAWWGNRSFVCGIGAVVANRKAHRQTLALAAPVRPADSPGPQDSGRPLWRRSGALVGVVMTLVLLFAALGIAATVESTPADEFEDACVRYDAAKESVGSVPCGGPHDGKVIDIVETEGQCPAATDAAVRLTDDADRTLCIDEAGPRPSTTTPTVAPNPTVAPAPAVAPTPTVAPRSPALKRYCGHAFEAEAFVKELDGGKVWVNDDRMANIRAFEIEALFSADATDLRREGRDVEATNVAKHSTALRQYFNSWVGRGPNPGSDVDILRDYYRASDQARNMCP